MSMKERYGTMMDNAFGQYYVLFRKKNALDKEHAVTVAELFGDGKPYVADRQMLRKMLSFGVIKRVNGDYYWLDEKRVENPGAVLKQRLLIIGLAMALALVYCVLMGDFTF